MTAKQRQEQRNRVLGISAGAAQAGSQKYHEVLVDGQPIGRRFTSLIAAQRYAAARGDGATVRPVT